MNIYFSGIGGVGIGPLAEIAHDAGYRVVGSDLQDSLMTRQLRQKGINVEIGQDGSFLAGVHTETPIDWFVYTASLPDDHPELVYARTHGIRTAKRDELIAQIIAEKQLKLIAVAGTHGKTTTTGMLIWTLQQLGVPVSYSVGTTVSFGPSGHYDPKSQYFIYECDEYDRNFLHFSPFLSLITSVDYDHPDTYPTEAEYTQAFRQFIDQSDHTILWQHDADFLASQSPDTWLLQDDDTLPLALPGAHNRRNGTLVVKALEWLEVDPSNAENVVAALASFPGTDRRFEQLSENLYTDYGHHPTEIAATLQHAREIAGDRRVALIYQPHQNSRQHEIGADYTPEVFEHADTIYWLPTYLTREHPDQTILTPHQLAAQLDQSKLHYAELDDTLWQAIQKERDDSTLVILMGAGTIDEWARARLSQ